MTKNPDKKSEPQVAAVGFNRPLLLSPAQDLQGYLAAVLGKMFLLGITCVSLMVVVLIFVFISKEAWPFFATHGIGKLLGSTSWYPTAEPAEFGGVSLLAGSLYVTAGALLIAVPIGLLAALFLSDIVSFRIRQFVKPIIELLAAIPSVAYGFFAVLIMAPWMQEKLHLPTGTNALNASIILAIMAIPTIISIAEDALSAAGRNLREGSYALGATRAETLVKVVVPAAHSGIIAAIILGMMRAVGETMVVWMASGNAARIPAPWWNITQSIRTMTATIAGEMGETAKGSDHYHCLFAVGFLLLVFTFALNLASEHFLSRARRLRGGSK
ncbi:MAG: phosphate ABC transporter permease subunit PstC [Planctomycetota bacterium]|nr:MAG: phosphate ABC transporter permease subunit PstC [Planctomycetota bacterium]